MDTNPIKRTFDNLKKIHKQNKKEIKDWEKILENPRIPLEIRIETELTLMNLESELGIVDSF